MKHKYKYLILIFLSLIVALMTLLKSPEELSARMNAIASDTKQLALLIHGAFLILFITGLFIKRARNIIFSLLILILSVTATLMSFKYRLIPNVVLFGTIFVLTLSATIKREIAFDISNIGRFGMVMAIISLITGFYYLHWVETPIWTNALLYSPLGIINCPTLITICGLLIFIKRPGLTLLELFTGFMTLYFGFFGIMRLGAKIDIILIVASIYLILRQASRLENTYFYRKLKEI